MIRHVFLWKVAKGADPQEIIRILDELPTKVPGIQSWSRGRHQGAPGTSGALWDGALITDFATWEALQLYSDHPFHSDVVDRLTPMFADRAVCDFELPAGAR